MLSDVAQVLACPVCTGGLTVDGAVLRCDRGHAFDVARHGYVNLLPGGVRPGTADTAEMVAARAAFLATDAFGPVADAVARAATGLADGVPGAVVDVGAGVGYYLARTLRELPDRPGLALDLSKHAARRAARAHVCIGAAVCDTWSGLPVRDAAAAVVLDVFAPRNAAEFARVLAAGGGVVVATPTPAHLHEVADTLDLIGIDDRKDARLAASFSSAFAALDDEVVEYVMELDRDTVSWLAGMGPSAHHPGEQERQARVSNLPECVRVTASVRVARFRVR